METIHYIPGNIGGLADHTIPATAPDIGSVVSAEITRLPGVLGAHAAGVELAHVPTVTAVGHAYAGADVDAHADHAHDLISLGVNGAVAIAIGWDAVPAANQLEDAGAAALHTLAGGLATGIQDTVIPAHGVTQPDDHPAVDILAAVDDHPGANVALGLANHLGADPVVASGAVVRLTPRTFTLANPTELGDLLTLNYHAVGERVAVA